MYLQALCYFPAAFAGFAIVEVTDALGFSGHFTIKVVRMFGEICSTEMGYFPFSEVGVPEDRSSSARAFGRSGFFPIVLGLSTILGAGLGPHVVGQRG